MAPVDRRWLWRRADGRVATEAVRRWSDRVRTLLQSAERPGRGSELDLDGDVYWGGGEALVQCFEILPKERYIAATYAPVWFKHVIVMHVI